MRRRRNLWASLRHLRIRLIDLGYHEAEAISLPDSP